MTRSQKLRLKRWIMRELDRSLSKAHLRSDMTTCAAPSLMLSGHRLYGLALSSL